MHPSSKPLFGIYVHWPYCLSKCPYCDFYSVVCKQPDYQKIFQTYQRDILFFKKKFAPKNDVTSVFFGGGTPSLMPTDLLKDLLNLLKENFSLDESVEITMEANPDAIDAHKMSQIKQLGINRLSIGVQALTESALKRLGRRHSLQTARSCIAEAKRYFEEVNADFIYARPEQTPAQWQEELNDILDLNLTHYSLYQLTIEENTPFYRQNIAIPDEDTAAQMYLMTNQIMSEAGFAPYEISNYAADEHRCLHNLTYWHGDDYLGIGPAAHGRIGLWATQNAPTTKKWFETMPLCEQLSQTERQEERILMGLRLMREGFPVEQLNPQGIQKAEQYGFGKVQNKLFYPSESGFLALNRLILMLLPEETEKNDFYS